MFLYAKWCRCCKFRFISINVHLEPRYIIVLSLMYEVCSGPKLALFWWRERMYWLYQLGSPSSHRLSMSDLRGKNITFRYGTALLFARWVCTLILRWQLLFSAVFYKPAYSSSLVFAGLATQWSPLEYTGADLRTKAHANMFQPGMGGLPWDCAPLGGTRRGNCPLRTWTRSWWGCPVR